METNNSKPSNILECILIGVKAINDNVIILSENLADAMAKIDAIYESLDIGGAQKHASAEEKSM